MNIDIIHIHLQIVHRLEENRDVHESQRRLDDLRKQLDNVENRASNNIVNKLKTEIAHLEEHIQQSKDGSFLNFYLLETVPIIEKYKQLTDRRVQVHFYTTSKQDKEMQETQNKKAALINEYVAATKTFFNAYPMMMGLLPNELCENNEALLNVLAAPSEEKKDQAMRHRGMTDPSSVKCRNKDCKNDAAFEMFDNQNVCRCGVVADQFDGTIVSYKDIERVNISVKYTYDRKIHFRDCFYQFQGKENVTVPPDLYKMITTQLVLHGIVPENYAELPKGIAFAKVTKEHVDIFLKDTKYVKHYENLVLIYHNLTGKPVPNLSHLEEDLMNDFDLLVEQYDKMFKQQTDRKNFINTHYVLYQLLQRYRYPCKKEDFNILKTIDRKLYHDTVCEQLFAELRWNFTPLF